MVHIKKVSNCVGCEYCIDCGRKNSYETTYECDECGEISEKLTLYQVDPKTQLCKYCATRYWVDSLNAYELWKILDDYIQAAYNKVD